MTLRCNLLAPFYCVILLSAVTASAEKPRDWHEGILLDSNRSRYFAGTIGNTNTNGTLNDNGNYSGNTSGSEVAVYRVYQNFVIEGDHYVYLAQEHFEVAVE